MKDRIRSVRDLNVYQQAFAAAMRIFEISKRFPPEEIYSLTDQIRKSSRSVCTSLAEGWRKRAYIAAFRAKLADAMQEAAETQTWLEFACACGYINEIIRDELCEEYEQILAQLNSMDLKAETFCFSNKDKS